MAKLWTPAEVAARLRIDPSRVRRLAEKYDIGVKIGSRMRAYTEEDVEQLTLYSTGKPGRPVRLSESLASSAALAEERAAQSIRDGDPESAESSMRLAAHLRRLSKTHAGSDNDPIQGIVPPSQN